MYLLKRWYGSLNLHHDRRPTAIQFSNTPNPQPQQHPSSLSVTTQSQQPVSSSSITSHHACPVDVDEDMIDADDLTMTLRKIYNALRQETIPRDVRSSLLPQIKQQLESIHDQVMESTHVTSNARFQRQRQHHH